MGSYETHDRIKQNCWDKKYTILVSVRFGGASHAGRFDGTRTRSGSVDGPGCRITILHPGSQIARPYIYVDFVSWGTATHALQTVGCDPSQTDISRPFHGKDKK